MSRIFHLILPLTLALLVEGQPAAADDAASCARRAGPEAIAACGRLITAGKEQGAGLAEIFGNRCAAWNRDHEPDYALADCSVAIGLDAGQAAARSSRGDSWRIMREYDRAIADYNEATRVDPKYAPAYGGRCSAWINKQELDRALTDCNTAIRIDAKYAPAYSSRCYIFNSKRDTDHATIDCDEAIRLDSKYAPAYNARAFLLRGKRDYDRAIADLNEAIRLDRKYTIGYNTRGLIWLDKRDYDRAIADYSEAIRLDPKYPHPYGNRCSVLYNKMELDRALSDCDQAISLDLKSAWLFNTRGLIWLEKRDYDRAIAEFDEVIRLDPKYLAAFTNRGLAFERKGEIERARTDFEAALALPETQSSSGKWAHDAARERLAALSTAQASPAAGSSAAQSSSKASRAPATRTSIERGPRVALLIGNTSYPDADPPLKQPRKDARALADELKRMGFDVEVAENLTKVGLQRAIDNFKQKIMPQSIALFFFSGYGVQVNRQAYILPTDSQIWTEADVARDGTSLETILAEMNGRGAAVKLAIIDAARRNPYERRFRSVAAGLAPVNVGKDSLLIYSVGLGQAFNETADEQSLFMTEFIQELRSPGISADEVFARARMGVSRASETEQVPWVASSLVESFYFVASGSPTAERRSGR